MNICRLMSSLPLLRKIIEEADFQQQLNTLYRTQTIVIMFCDQNFDRTTKTAVKVLSEKSLDPRGCSRSVLPSVLSDSIIRGQLKAHQFTSGIKCILTQDTRDKPPMNICHFYIVLLYAYTHLLHWNKRISFFPKVKGENCKIVQ